MLATARSFPAWSTLLEQEYVTATDPARREQLEAFRGQVPCAACGGARLRPEALGVRIAGRNIAEVCRLSIGEGRELFAGLRRRRQLRISQTQPDIAEPILREIAARLGFLEKVGLDYLTLDRPADTLCGGELQRVRLATGIGCGLVGVCYILDEPSIGLHPRDNQRLIDALRDLQAQRQHGARRRARRSDDAAGRLADRHRPRRRQPRRAASSPKARRPK